MCHDIGDVLSDCTGSGLERPQTVRYSVSGLAQAAGSSNTALKFGTVMVTGPARFVSLWSVCKSKKLGGWSAALLTPRGQAHR